MIPYFPKQILYRAIIVYLAALLSISIYYSNYAMSFGYMVAGLLCVAGFFLATTEWSRGARTLPEKQFLTHVFLVALVLRLVWVVFSYYYYTKVTGIPFEFQARDSLAYHEDAEWMAGAGWEATRYYLFESGFIGPSDTGYPLYLTVIYKIFGPHIIVPRIIKALLSAYMCILIYKICLRTFDESVARMAAIMCCLMPNLIIYCGYHLKETEMIFIAVAFLERTDYLLRAKKWNFVNIIIPMLLAGSLFFFRTIIGAAAVFSFLTSVLIINTPSMKKGWKRTAIIGWGLAAVLVAGGGTVMTEIEGIWEDREDQLTRKRTEQTLRGNQWAKYATGTVMAPMVVVLPFSTMIDVDEQYGQQEKHGGNFIRNFMGIFALLAIYEAFRRKEWRNFALIGSFVVAYLGVVSLSGFSNSERFLLPGLPGLIMMWAYGVSTLREKTWKLVTPWCIIVFVMEFAWAFFKLGSRGLM